MRVLIKNVDNYFRGGRGGSLLYFEPPVLYRGCIVDADVKIY